MLNGLRRRVTFANVTSMLALSVALGGTGYAATALASNSVGSPQIKSDAVKNSELANDAVSTTNVKDGSLRAKDFAAGQLPAGPKGATGAPGATGATGAAGAPGTPGAAGTIGAVTSRSFTAAADMTADQKASFSVYCPAGQQALGGGGRGDDGNSELTKITSSRPAVSAANTEPPADGLGFTGWRLTVQNVGNNLGIRPTVWVFCAAAPTA